MRGVPVERVEARAYTIPTDQPESDGTLQWTSTTLVVVEVSGGGKTGLGYTYADKCIVSLIAGKLAGPVQQQDVMHTGGAWHAMQRAVRNLGREGLAATAISAVDTALWDLKARLLDVPLVVLLGMCRDAVAIYGSGGFTNYSDHRLRAQLSAWVQQDGCRWVKMKVGSEPDRDPQRVPLAKRCIGSAGLFVDANGAYDVKQALRLAGIFADSDVAWFEEPVSSDDLVGLRLLRQRTPACMEIAAGEYGYTTDYFHRMLSAEAVDVQQVDITRCGGFTGWLAAIALCKAHHIDVSAHCAPSLHLHAGCAPPVAAGLLANAALGACGKGRRLTRWWLRLTAILGIAGVGFHAYGIARSMGGWRNWSQNLLAGPPIPAPPSFTGLALAGLAALGLLRDQPDA